MIDRDILNVAASQGDETAERHGLRAALERVGINHDDALYVASQRALRLVLIDRGEALPTESGPIMLTDAEEETHRKYTTMCLDGISIGVRATR